MKQKLRHLGTLAVGAMLGAALCGGASAAVAGVTATPSVNSIYLDGQTVELEAYKINGCNYVKLRDIGEAVGFNVYWDDGVQIDSDAAYTGVSPESDTESTPPAKSVRPVATDEAIYSAAMEKPLHRAAESLFEHSRTHCRIAFA